MFESLVRRMLYYPIKIDKDQPIPYYISGADEVWMKSADGNDVHGLYWTAPAGRPTILFFHGNAQSVYEWALIYEELAPMECGLLLIDYPGYGKSTGTPEEDALYNSGEAALDWLVKSRKLSEKEIIVFGKSLGGGVTTEVAQGREPLGVILESTFQSIPSVVNNLIPMVPAGSILRSEIYESIAKIGSISAPVLIVHGTEDELIPVSESKALFEKAREPKQLYLAQGAGHNDVSMMEGGKYGQTLRRWLDEIRP